MLKMFDKLFQRRPDKTYKINAVFHADTSDFDGALKKAEELEAVIKRARTLAGELARMTRLIRLNVELDTCPAEWASIVTDFDGDA